VQIYAAFNSDGVSVLISDADLDDAARAEPPLSTELADAAAQARRTELLDHLHRSLEGNDRARKLAVAKALLALEDTAAGTLLTSLADAESDSVVAKSFRAVATRLAGPQAALEMFTDPVTDPQLARLLVSNYNSHLRPGIGDVRFLIHAMQRYVDRSLPWLTGLRGDLWDNGVFLMLNGLSNEHSVRLLRDHAGERTALVALLAQLGEHTDDDDILAEAESLRAAVSAD
jgi:hypothetical protein